MSNSALGYVCRAFIQKGTRTRADLAADDARVGRSHTAATVHNTGGAGQREREVNHWREARNAFQGISVPT